MYNSPWLVTHINMYNVLVFWKSSSLNDTESLMPWSHSSHVNILLIQTYERVWASPTNHVLVICSSVRAGCSTAFRGLWMSQELIRPSVAICQIGHLTQLPTTHTHTLTEVTQSPHSHPPPVSLRHCEHFVNIEARFTPAYGTTRWNPLCPDSKSGHNKQEDGGV